MTRRILRYFLQGLLFLAPVSITVFILVEGFLLVDGLFNFKIPGLGLLVILAGVTLIGFLGSTFLFKPITSYFNRLLEKIPLFKIIYSSIKDLMSAFVGQKKKFNVPVLVKVNKDSELEKMGFITETDLSKLGIEEGKVAVYLPHSYNFSGNLFIVPKANIKLIQASPTNVMKFIVSGGVTSV